MHEKDLILKLERRRSSERQTRRWLDSEEDMRTQVIKKWKGRAVYAGIQSRHSREAKAILKWLLGQ